MKKRVREDAYTESHSRTRIHLSSPGETNGKARTTREGLTARDALVYLKTVRDIFHDNQEKYETFLEVMKDFKSQRVNTLGVIKRIKDLFKGYKDLLLGFNTFLPQEHRIILPEDEKPKTSVNFKDAIGFVKKAKASFEGDQHAYKRFLDILDMYRKERKSISDVYKEVTKLFKGHQDLLVEFVNFLPNDSESASATNTIHEHSDQQEDGDDNLVACSAGNSLGNSLVKEGQRRNLNAKDKKGIQDFENREDTERDTDRTARIAASVIKGIEDYKSQLSANKYLGTPINELDLSQCIPSTPSYRLLPEDYPVEIPSYRNKIGKNSLNDHLVAVTSGSEDYSFNHMRKNQYEESLFRCEDDRYEMDMLLGSVDSAIENVATLLENINNNTVSTETVCIENYLSSMNLRCIERLYGDHGLEIIDLLKKNMHSALPVILTRLTQKQEEWVRCHSDFQKIWAGVYAKNHHKSLDHHTFYFKQQDSKNLSTKCLVAEIKDISEKNHQEDLHQAIAVTTMPSFIPDMEFNYCDAQIHEDLYLLIKYYCKEIYAAAQSDKVMKLWTTFLEPMFGILSRSQCNLPIEDVSMAKDNQESDPCVAKKDTAFVPNHKHPISPKLLKKVNPVVQGSSPGKDVSAKVASPRNKQLMVDVNNHKVNKASVGKHEVEREEGELSPTNSCENGLKPLQKLMGDVRSSKVKQSCEKKGACCSTETGSKSNGRAEDGKTENSNKLSKDNEPASKMIDSQTKFGCHEENNRAVNINGNEGESTSFAFSDRFLQTVKPVAKHVSWPSQASEAGSRNDGRVFYGNDSYYVLFRLHQMLYQRIQSAKKFSEIKRKASDNTTPDSYSRFMDALYNLLEGTTDNLKFEDECRSFFGTQSYILFTLDKLVQKFVKHLHAVAADETDTKLLQLYAYENFRKPGRFFDLMYHENARALLHDANIYRITYSSTETRLSVQLMSSCNNHPEVAAAEMEPGFEDYLQNTFLSSANDEEKHKVFLRRNKEKLTGVDEFSGRLAAMEGLSLINEIEYKMGCNTSKMKYVTNTSDLLYRSKQRKPNLTASRPKGVSEITKQSRISRFNIMLNCKLCALPPL